MRTRSVSSSEGGDVSSGVRNNPRLRARALPGCCGWSTTLKRNGQHHAGQHRREPPERRLVDPPHHGAPDEADQRVCPSDGATASAQAMPSARALLRSPVARPCPAGWWRRIASARAFAAARAGRRKRFRPARSRWPVAVRQTSVAAVASQARSISASTFGRNSTPMQIRKIRKACSVPLSLRYGVKRRTVMSESPRVFLVPKRPVEGEQEHQPERAGEIAEDAQQQMNPADAAQARARTAPGRAAGCPGTSAGRAARSRSMSCGVSS